MKRLIIPGLTTKWKYPRPPPRVASKINTAMKMILRFIFTGRWLNTGCEDPARPGSSKNQTDCSSRSESGRRPPTRGSNGVPASREAHALKTCFNQRFLLYLAVAWPRFHRHYATSTLWALPKPRPLQCGQIYHRLDRSTDRESQYKRAKLRQKQ
jgi:hypothetical protein